MTLENITLDGNNVEVKYNGSLVMAEASAVTIKAGATLCNATSALGTHQAAGGGSVGYDYAYGGAIHLEGASAFTMSGGSIINCQAAYGGAISDMGTGNMTISGGIIDNCVASAAGGGIHKDIVRRAVGRDRS